MSRKLIDLTGKRFGKLTVIARIHSNTDTQAKWLCVCECGNLTESFGNSLRQGEAKGCIWCRSKTHGKTPKRLYNIWLNMKQRCTNINATAYKHYGGRGISVCDEWNQDYTAFRDWALANGYSDKLTIDRINVDGDYSPDNCRWVDMKTQSRNTRGNKLYTIDGVTKCLQDWCDYYNINRSTVCGRILRDWGIKKALTTQVRKKES